MKLFSYIKYFFYLAFNWYFKIAWYIIKQEIKGEKKYGITTTGADELKSLEKKGIDIEHATISGICITDEWNIYASCNTPGMV